MGRTIVTYVTLCLNKHFSVNNSKGGIKMQKSQFLIPLLKKN